MFIFYWFVVYLDNDFEVRFSLWIPKFLLLIYFHMWCMLSTFNQTIKKHWKETCYYLHQALVLLKLFFRFSWTLMETLIGKFERITLNFSVLLLTLHILRSVCIFSTLFFIHFPRCWLGEFLCQSEGSFPGYHFLYSHDLNAWYKSDIAGRN